MKFGKLAKTGDKFVHVNNKASLAASLLSATQEVPTLILVHVEAKENVKLVLLDSRIFQPSS